MKIAYGSDIHLEFGDVELMVSETPDVLILAGDILCVEPLRKMNSENPSEIVKRYLKFFQKVSEDFPETILIMGNHEHYGGYWNKTLQTLREIVRKYPNIHVLEKEFWEFRDKVFYAGTMWTNYDKGNPLELYQATRMMNDYRAITEEVSGIYRKLQPETCFKDHREYLNKLTEVYGNTNKDLIVVSHHAPHEFSISEKYKEDRNNFCYFSDLHSFIESRPRIRLWVHGHIHSESDYLVPDTNTRVVSNPRGYYNLEHNSITFELKLLEI